MQRTLLTFALMTALLVPAVAAGEGSTCRQFKADPAGDTRVPAGVPGFDSTPADLLGVELAWLDEGARLTVHLNGDPRVAGSGPMTYSYWVGFQDGGKSAQGNTATWTFQGSTKYDLIQAMYWDGSQQYPVLWNGTAFSFVVPWAAFEEQYGSAWPIDFGSPSASSAGPSATGLNNPSQDWVDYGQDVVPLQPCPKEDGKPVADGAQAGSPGKPAEETGAPPSGSAPASGGAEPAPAGAEAGGVSDPAEGAPANPGSAGLGANATQAKAPAPAALLVGLALLAVARLRRR